MNSLTPKPPRIGIALSGGAARGLAHIGVLKALEEESIPIDIIAGTSAGAAIGACYAEQSDANILEKTALDLNWKIMTRLADLNLLLLGKGIFQGQKVMSLLSSIIGDVQFEDLKIPFAAVATDIQSMEEIVIDKGSVLEAVRASISMPVIFTPVKWQTRFLIDGGVVNPMPVNVARSMGADIVIAVNVAAITHQNKCKNSIVKKKETEQNHRIEEAHSSVAKKGADNLIRKDNSEANIFDKLYNIANAKINISKKNIDPETPNILTVLMQSIYAMQYEKIRLASKSADIVIIPDIKDIGEFGFHKGSEAIAQGYKATKDILPRLQKMIRCP